jgi:hypothetical protein
MTDAEHHKQQAINLVESALIEMERSVEWEEVEDDEGIFSEHERWEERRLYLGSILGLTPSGKMYTPFAASNVDPCPKCEGEGDIQNPDGHPAREHAMDTVDHVFRIFAIHFFGYATEWPSEVEEISAALNRVKEKWSPRIDCPDCGGMGSAEAYLDEIWNETIQEEADRRNAYIDYRDGDIFLVRQREIEDEP